MRKEVFMNHSKFPASLIFQDFLVQTATYVIQVFVFRVVIRALLYAVEI